VDEKRKEKGVSVVMFPYPCFFWELYDGKEEEVGKKEE